ncbi:hypothetical protein Gorai_021581 [Gossypium raimondii]|uniref:Uncharacterized protein n=1 Tax=Gossypium raimondii TaxID=29730 RepID=A0A7J8NR52_GOSRA|nr:hypothetical protein [Gossypium raimondii]
MLQSRSGFSSKSLLHYVKSKSICGTVSFDKLSLSYASWMNLLVTSTLTVCTEPYPEMMPNPEAEKATEEAPLQSNSVQNGVESMVGDRDEIMTEVEADIEEMTIDVDAFQEMVGPSEANSTAAENS